MRVRAPSVHAVYTRITRVYPSGAWSYTYRAEFFTSDGLFDVDATKHDSTQALRHVTLPVDLC